ncbi:MAG: hypothetical protein QM589_16565 [Thermomicrobiales bacterium]
MAITAPRPPAQSSLDRLAEAASGAPVAAIDATTSLLEQTGGSRRSARPRQASVTRILRAVAELAEHSDAAAMAQAASEGSDYAVLLALLDQPEVLAALRARDPLAPARLRGLRSREVLLMSEGGTLTAQEVGAMLGVTRQAVDNRRKRGKLVAVELGRRGYAYPAWQFRAGSVLPGLDRVLEVFAGSGVWALLAFILNGNAWLDGERPLDVLRAGRVEDACRAAALYGEQAAA